MTTRGPEAVRERVLLVSMPFGALERPALSLSLLSAHCARLGIPCETQFFMFDFARRIGVGDYLWLCSDDVPYTAFAGEWLFTEALYGRRPFADAAYVDEVLKRTWRLDSTALERLKRVRGQVEPFLRECLGAVDWSRFTLVGFTSVFQQNVASLALAERVKRKFPDLDIAFGGANWEEKMGAALQAEFPFVDLAFSGEADESFPAVLKARAEGRSTHGLPGVTTSAASGAAQPAPAQRVREIDRLPTPDFAPFFEAFHASVVSGMLAPTLLMETSRGCWWGERAHCTFCGLNGATMAYRSKSADRVLEEVSDVRARYGVRTVNMVDDILDMSYFRTVLPRLADAKLGVEFFWEIKSNLTHDQVRLLRDAGVKSVQPGVESLSDRVLKLMRKGVTAFRNIELLKWCKEYGVKPYWNLLYGFPGETEEDYASTAALIEAIWHLDPPTGYGPLRVDRFSPYHNDPKSFGLTNLRPMAPFTYIYPFEASRLADIAYYFEFDYTADRRDDEFAGVAIPRLREWMEDGARGMLSIENGKDGEATILDTRRASRDAPKRAKLSGWKAAVFLACNRAQPLSILQALPVVQEACVDAVELDAFLRRCEKHKFMVRNGSTWLNVAVHTPERAAAHDDAEPSKWAPIRGRAAQALASSEATVGTP